MEELTRLPFRDKLTGQTVMAVSTSQLPASAFDAKGRVSLTIAHRMTGGVPGPHNDLGRSAIEAKRHDWVIIEPWTSVRAVSPADFKMSYEALPVQPAEPRIPPALMS